jgi:glycosyltransferase involved in cell wall biosynthesis
MQPEIAKSVVLPAYNEEAALEDTVEDTLEALDSFLDSHSYELIVVEDGCDDRTPGIADRLARSDSRVRHVHSSERLGRGAALTAAFERSEGDILGYLDADLATDMRHLEELIESTDSGGYDIATGSRWLPDSEADRSIDRKSASWVYNRLVRLMLPSDLRDHQCGFKAFRRDALFEILPSVENDHWFWDTEVLVRAQLRGFEVKEFPVEWMPEGGTKVDLAGDARRMGEEIFRLWRELSVERRILNGPEPVNQF